jgi:hypothetical protein
MPTPPTPRTTQALVQAIIDVEPDFDVSPFITAANMLTTGVCTYPAPRRHEHGKVPYTDGFIGSQMEIIERWLAAHFYQVFDTAIMASRALDASATFAIKIDYDLRSTIYGQQAMVLDFQANLAKWNNSMKVQKRIKIGGHWLGERRDRWSVDADFGWLLTVEQ